MNFQSLLAYALMLLFAATGGESVFAQRFDLLPDIQPSPYPVRATLLTTGLPVENEMVTEVFTQRVGPTDLTVVPDGSGDVIVAAYGGTAHRLDASGVVSDELFLDFRGLESPTASPNFDVGGAHGFTAIEFHPDFSNAGTAGFGKFYTIESEVVGAGTPDFVNSARSGRHHDDAVYEYTLVDPRSPICDQACADSKRELLRVLQPGWHHNLADLLFDTDGSLLIASADGSTSRTFAPFMSDNGQQLSTVFGNILRIDPLGSNGRNGQYGIPSTNPFVGDDMALDEIYAYGFRNPHRLEINDLTGELYTTDTGESRIESVYRVAPGGNHGWNLKEGSFVYDKTTKEVVPDLDSDGSGVGDIAEANQLTEPIFEYDRDFGDAIIGTALNRDTRLSYLGDALVFGDFTGKLYYGDLATGEEFEFQLTEDSDALPLQIHSINTAADGGIRVLGIRRTADGFDGVIVGIEPCFGSALPGDFDRSGVVDFVDFLILSDSFGETDRDFSSGDATCDGRVSFPDFLTLSRNFGQELGSRTRSVPEPDSHRLLLISVSFLALVRRSSRRK